MWNKLREEIFAIFLNFGQIRLSLTRKKYFCKNPRKFIPREMNFKDQLDEIYQVLPHKVNIRES